MYSFSFGVFHPPLLWQAKKLGELPANFPRNYKHWGSPGVHNENQGEV